MLAETRMGFSVPSPGSGPWSSGEQLAGSESSKPRTQHEPPILTLEMGYMSDHPAKRSMFKWKGPRSLIIHYVRKLVPKKSLWSEQSEQALSRHVEVTSPVRNTSLS